MAPNADRNLILVKGEDKTSSILTWRFDKYKPVVFITYKNNRSYPYNTDDVQFFKNPKVVILDDCIALKNDLPMGGVISVQYFQKYCRINYKTGYSEVALSSSVRIIKSELQVQKSRQCFEYLKELATKIGLIVDGENILAKRYEKIDFVREDSVFAAFLSGRYPTEAKRKHTPIVYPFGFNLSQKKAVEHALEHPLSVIEGPPGTGKTQTILNIVANAVMRNESVAVVSSNNSATANVYEKLKKYGVHFIAAPLGNSSNKETFIEEQNSKLPNMSQWKEDAEGMASLRQEEAALDKVLGYKNELSSISLEQTTIEKEWIHFKDYYKTLIISGEMPHFARWVSAEKILEFLVEYELLLSNQVKLTFLRRFIFMLTYGLRNCHFYGKSIDEITPYCQNLYYERRQVEINRKKKELEIKLSVSDFEQRMSQYADLSMTAFKAKLAKKYGSVRERKIYVADDLLKESESFIKDYPVVLSTTYSLRTSLSHEYVYDYVIVDEASQVDIVTGALALSCAKKAVIVGDLKQLPNVVDQNQKQITDEVFNQYELSSAYRYADHSLLSSIISLFPDVPHVLLREHYRCHPEIIGFCNQCFYNNELLVLTKPTSDKQPLIVYRTVKGNHARNHINQRQIDVIVDEVIPEQKLNRDDGSVGIVTPYRNQADELQKVFSNSNIKADTADKFQGQERSVMLFSTVDNEIGEFASNPNRLNVAVSRAIDQFIVVTDGNDNDSTSPIHELIGYIQYHNHEIVNSQIRSVFDCLYKDYADVRENVLRKYGRISDMDSENLMYCVIRDALEREELSKYDVVLHVPIRMILNDYQKLNRRELEFVTNHLTHVDFLIFSKLTHQPVLVIEVDGFKYHNNEKQKERDGIKNRILEKYNIPILRFNTIGSRESDKLLQALTELNKTL